MLVFDVNVSLGDLTPLRARFEDIGAPGHLLPTWFAGILRDGFALTAAGSPARRAPSMSQTCRAKRPATTACCAPISPPRTWFCSAAP
ncbi:hypothetical protein OIE50_18395 [Streptomyces canus]|uniref:hypothetical protein n=1 Tax=Streptomyces canus TaxID=58343 RepID=UPI003256900B